MTETPQGEKDCSAKTDSWNEFGKCHKCGARSEDTMHTYHSPARCPQEPSEIEALRAKLADAEGKIAPKTFPLMASRGDENTKPGPFRIPWSVAEIAYGAYAAKYGREQSLERLAERGGFYWGEMDDLHPEWRDEVSEIVALRQRAQAAESRSSALEAEIGVMRDALQPLIRAAEARLGGEPFKITLMHAAKAQEALDQPLTTSLSDRMQREKAVIEAAARRQYTSTSSFGGPCDHVVMAFDTPEDAEAFKVAIDALTAKGEME